LEDKFSRFSSSFGKLIIPTLGGNKIFPFLLHLLFNSSSFETSPDASQKTKKVRNESKHTERSSTGGINSSPTRILMHAPKNIQSNDLLISFKAFTLSKINTIIDSELEVKE
jgi:uncharacterized membrane protein